MEYGKSYNASEDHIEIYGKHLISEAEKSRELLRTYIQYRQHRRNLRLMVSEAATELARTKAESLDEDVLDEAFC